MDKTAIKNYAIWARRKLKEEIATRAGFLGITENGIRKPLEASTGEIQYFDIGADKPVSIRGKEIQQRENLVKKLSAEAERTDYHRAYEQMIETSAYDWFNRLIAIRYMEVNEYEPLDIRLLSSVEEGKQDPDRSPGCSPHLYVPAILRWGLLCHPLHSCISTPRPPHPMV